MVAAMQHRSLLDPIPGRGRVGMTRDMVGDDDDETSPRALLRHYQAEMRREHGRVPTLGEIVAAGWAARSCFDMGKDRQILETLHRTMSGRSWAGVSSEASLCPMAWPMTCSTGARRSTARGPG